MIRLRLQRVTKKPTKNSTKSQYLTFEVLYFTTGGSQSQHSTEQFGH